MRGLGSPRSARQVSLSLSLEPSSRALSILSPFVEPSRGWEAASGRRARARGVGRLLDPWHLGSQRAVGSFGGWSGFQLRIAVGVGLI